MGVGGCLGVVCSQHSTATAYLISVVVSPTPKWHLCHVFYLPPHPLDIPWMIQRSNSSSCWGGTGFLWLMKFKTNKLAGTVICLGIKKFVFGIVKQFMPNPTLICNANWRRHWKKNCKVKQQKKKVLFLQDKAPDHRDGKIMDVLKHLGVWEHPDHKKKKPTRYFSMWTIWVFKP